MWGRALSPVPPSAARRAPPLLRKKCAFPHSNRRARARHLLQRSARNETNSPRPPLPRLRVSFRKTSHGPRKLWAGAAPLVDNQTSDHRTQQKTARELIWTSTHSFHGWTCSQCEWNSPLPTLLNDPAARTAYDRLAAGKFKDHKCSDHLSRQGSADDADSFTPASANSSPRASNPKMPSNSSSRKSPSNTATSPKSWPRPNPTPKISSAESAPA
jgi:hypothetical protein